MRSFRVAVSLLVLSLAAGCASKDESAASSIAEATEAPALDCAQLGSFPAAAMLGVGDGTYVRADAAPAASTLERFTLGPLLDVPGWGGKKAEYTRSESQAETSQTGTITVIFDNPAIGAVITFEDAAKKAANDAYFITASSVVDGETTALCLASPATGDRFLMKRL